MKKKYAYENCWLEKSIETQYITRSIPIRADELAIQAKELSGSECYETSKPI